MKNTENLLAERMRTPRRAVLKRVCRSCFEPRRGRDPVSGLFARKPTANDGRALWRPPTGPRDATETPAAPASHPHSGQSVFACTEGSAMTVSRRVSGVLIVMTILCVTATAVGAANNKPTVGTTIVTKYSKHTLHA